MKQLFTFLLAAMAFVACTQNEVEELSANREALPETLTVGFEGGDTRVELNEALKTVWTEGDEVSVFYRSYENTRWAFQGETGDRSGELILVSGEVGAQTMDNSIIVYPYSDSYAIDADTHAVTASLPAVQSYKEGSYGAEGNIMVAESKFTQFTLKSVVGWLRVELTGEGEVVESVKVRGNDGEQVAGLVYINAADASIALAGSEVEESLVATEVVLNCGEGVELSAEATEFYVALLPQTFEKGLTVEVDYSNGNSQTLVCDSSITIRRNHISPIESEASEEEDVVNSQIFYTASALVEPYDATAFNVAIGSNEWDETTGEGVITFDGELTTIGNSAFYWCDSLTSVTIPDSVTTIGNSAFYGCLSLTSVTIPDSVTTIGNSAFYWCDSLTSVTIPDSVTTIEYSAFYYCTSLTSVTIGNSVTTIGDSAFRDCDRLTSVTIPDSVTTIGEAAFGGCSNLAEFKGKFAADGGRCLIKDNTIIAYAEASGTTYTIPDSVTTIGEYAFRDCRSLTSVTIPDSVTTIGGWAFSDCKSLTSITIGDSVTTIGNYAFYKCDSLTSVYCEATTPPSLGYDAFKYYGNGYVNIGCAIYVPAESVEAYKAVSGWSEYAADIVGYDYNSTETISYTTSDGMPANASGLIISNSYQNGVGELKYFGKDIIPAGLFRNCDNLTSVTIPDSVTTIGYEAFYWCSSLTSVTIPDSVTTIGEKVFYACDGLTSVTIGDSVTTIGDRAFYNCTSLTSVTIPDSVTTIGDYAFYECRSLTSVTIPDSVTTIGDYAFHECRSLTRVTIPDSVTTIGDSAFYRCHSLTSVTIGNGVTTIGYEAFYWCSSLTSVTIPDSVTTIGNLAFADCTSLVEFKGKFAADGGRCLIKDNTIIAYANASGTTYTLPDSVTTIGDSAFRGCDSLTSVTIPDSVTTIGDEAFYNCTNLTSIIIPDSVTTIGDWAFCYCKSLTSVYCEATTPPTLGGSYVFDRNKSGRKIYVPAESVEEYKAAANWSEYAADIVGYDFETGEVVE